MLLNCIDYRLTGRIAGFMDDRGLAGSYDQVVLAGASLGVQADARPAWRETFWEHLELAIQLHAIQRVLVVDHRDCGAYKLLLGRDLAAEPVLERQEHARWLRSLKDAIGTKYPRLRTELYLMALDGSIEQIK